MTADLYLLRYLYLFRKIEIDQVRHSIGPISIFTWLLRQQPLSPHVNREYPGLYNCLLHLA